MGLSTDPLPERSPEQGAPEQGAPGQGAPERAVPAPAHPPLRSEVLTGLVCAVGVVLLGAPVGLLWRALASRPQIALTPGGGVDLVDGETEAYVRGDATLLVLGVLAGVLVGLLAWRLARRGAVGALVGVVAGAAVAAWVAARTGMLDQDRAAVLAAARAGRGAVGLPLQLRARAVLLGWPAAAAVTFAVLALRRPAVLDPRPDTAAPAPGVPDTGAAPDTAVPEPGVPGPAGPGGVSSG